MKTVRLLTAAGLAFATTLAMAQEAVPTAADTFTKTYFRFLLKNASGPEFDTDDDAIKNSASE